ncbi:unnamed protein product [Clonostachys byssicola]|uniref:Uncharacterized protein n=1 Tax=Clonostachys byssicola TaxID=160290 RepID=A0A9N9USV6_9HYPO|nr:unnamed protein product [Clonostachys byssicola]
MAGFLVPDHYVVVEPPLTDLLVASIIWGFTLAVGIFSGHKAIKQTYAQWKRSGRAKPYIFMVWAEWIASTVIGCLAWLFLCGYIAPRYVNSDRPATVCLWVVQIQCICGIIINRISLLMVDRRNATKIRWITAIVLGLINISVFVIWIPAQLQISQKWIDINHIWDRIEKGLFLLIDAALHVYFIYLIRVKLIANGLEKYIPLLRFNIFMVFVSMSLDIILIGTMSIGNGFIYVQFHPLIYMLKLHIEMNISSLIVRVVMATGDKSSYINEYQQGTELQSKSKSGNTNRAGPGASNRTGGGMDSLFSSGRNEVHIDADGQAAGKKNAPRGGITRVIQTQVTVASRHDQDDASSESSMRQLKNSTQHYHDTL